ncbi:MAG: HD domain-containing protein [Oscillospiraceae bacterium]|nr:HD domain-containing protein [Oscillospiraceae bacterium]
MITYALAAKLFEGFSILRWNDRLRPVELLEIDHHALKSMLTYFLGQIAQQQDASIDWRKIVDYSIMEMLGKISTSDIQSAVRKRLKGEIAFNNLILNDWSKPSLKMNASVMEGLKNYINDENYDSIENMIVRFCHKYVTSREFEIIEKFSLKDDIIKPIEIEIDKDMKESTHEAFVKEAAELRSMSKSSWLPSIMGIISRLRYQIRWSQTPRIPETSVLGHSMYCATLAYFVSIEANLDDHRVVNNFYAALFHDLPEALSRDIISPVKKADEAIEKLIAEIEKEFCENEIMSIIPTAWQGHFRFITGQLYSESNILPYEILADGNELSYEISQNEFLSRGEFSNRVLLENGKYIIVPWGDDLTVPYFETMEEYMDEAGIDGKLVKACDNISAYMEARMSLQHGIRSAHLDNGVSNTLAACNGQRVYSLSLDDFFESITF